MTDSWAPLADKFFQYYGTVQGRVRTHLIDRHLRSHLTSPPADVVDVGGGAGHQALPLARDGYRVTIVEPSAAMLQRASELIAMEPPEVRDRVTLVQAAGEDAVTAVGGRKFEGVLCHAVLQYLDDPLPMIAELAALAAETAAVSVVAKNQRSMAIPPALAGHWEEALSAFEANHRVCGLGVDTRADTVEDLGRRLAGYGVDVVAWYGVGFFTDWWAPDRPATQGSEGLLAVELEASRRDPYRQLGRMFQLVGVRGGAPVETR